MMREVYVVADNITSPIGSTTTENFERARNGISGIKQHDNKAFAGEPFFASLFASDAFISNSTYTRFEQLLIASIEDVLQRSGLDAGDKNTALIVSSTKGNISLLETEQVSNDLQKRIALPESARLVGRHFGFADQPIVISNACISGIMAIITGMRLIRSGQYQNVVVAGADVISRFILSGFQSFQAISSSPCKPFDISRDGITLGEGAASLILSAQKPNEHPIKVIGGAVSNDANHISAPSRTGAELSQAINKTLAEGQLSPAEIDLVSAHGTATLYNDEMEAKAITLAGLQNVPLNSLKGFYGHTLGAAGLIESIITMRSLKDGVFLPTLGFSEIGVSAPVNVNARLLHGGFKNCLKTASGFGGCNAAIGFAKQI